jgi:hypothetical protein
MYRFPSPVAKLCVQAEGLALRVRMVFQMFSRSITAVRLRSTITMRK